MTNDEVLNLPGSNRPVLLADGCMGMLLIYPTTPEATCGIQVHGEKEHRQIPAENLVLDGGYRLRQIGGVLQPPVKPDMVHTLLAMQWDL